MNTIRNPILRLVLFLVLFKLFHSQDEQGVNRQQNVTSEPSSSSSSFSNLETEKETTTLLSTDSSNDRSNQSQQLLIISFDGFRYDYFDAFELDNLRSISKYGVRAAKGMKGIFTTKTFPSHWSIATGMYQQNHGVVGNRFYDPITKAVFGKGKSGQIDQEWFKGEPIWVTAKKNGKKVGIYFWVGSEIDFGSHLNPDEVKEYNQSVPLQDRIDQVIHWLNVSKYDLVMMYWNQPDTVGHAYGTFSAQVNQSLIEIDGQLNRLITALKKENLFQKTNIIILSDHGMTNTTTHVTFTPNVTDNVIYSNEGVVTHFWPKNGSEEIVAKFLETDLGISSLKVSNQVNEDELSHNITEEDIIEDDRRLLSARHLHDSENVTSLNETTTSSSSSSSRPQRPFYTIYKKDQLPEKWKYKNNDRVAPIVVVAEEGVYLQQDGSIRSKKLANHGYDNDLLSMRPLFIASGPSFKTNYSFDDPIEMINLYSLFCNLLNIQPSTTNEGSMENVKHILSSHSANKVVANDETTVTTESSPSTHSDNSSETGTENYSAAKDEVTEPVNTTASSISN